MEERSKTLTPLPIQAIIPLDIIGEIIETYDLSSKDLYNLCLIPPFSEAAFRALYRHIPFFWDLRKTTRALQTLATRTTLNASRPKLVRTLQLDLQHELSVDFKTLQQMKAFGLDYQRLFTSGHRSFMSQFMSRRSHAPRMAEINEALLNLPRLKHLHIHLSQEYSLFSHSQSQELFVRNIFKGCVFNSLESFTATSLEFSLSLVMLLSSLTSPTLSRLVLDIHTLSNSLESDMQSGGIDFEALLRVSFPALKSLAITPYIPQAFICALTTDRPIEEISIFNQYRPISPRTGRCTTLTETLTGIVRAGVTKGVSKLFVKYLESIEFGDVATISRDVPNIVHLTLASTINPFIGNSNGPLRIITNLTKFKYLQRFTIQGACTEPTSFHSENGLPLSNVELCYVRENMLSYKPAIRVLFQECETLLMFNVSLRLTSGSENHSTDSLESLVVERMSEV